MFQLSQHDIEILKTIFKNYSHIKFYVFGSRAKSKAKEYSDLDLAYLCDNNKDIVHLKNQLEDSDLTIMVDLIDLKRIDGDFKKLIENEMKAIDFEKLK